MPAITGVYGGGPHGVTGPRIIVDAIEPMLMLQDAQGATSQLGTAMWLRNLAHPYLVDQIKRRFGNEGDDVVGKWQQLGPNTGAIRQGKGFAPWHPINQRTGEMLAFLTTSFRVQGYGTATSLTIPNQARGEMKQKITIAQLGGYPKTEGRRLGPSRMAPARPVLGIGSRDAMSLKLSLIKFIRSGAI